MENSSLIAIFYFLHLSKLNFSILTSLAHYAPIFLPFDLSRRENLLLNLRVF